MTLAERFAQKHGTGPGCWEWTGGRNGCGYGRFWIGAEGRHRTAHRFAWELYRGQIPDGLHVLHHCDNPGCVNPGHLFLGTQAENNRDMASKGRARNEPRPGEKHPLAKLNNPTVLEIRRRVARGEPQAGVAKAFGVSHQTVSAIKLRKTWRHLEDSMKGAEA